LRLPDHRMKAVATVSAADSADPLDQYDSYADVDKISPRPLNMAASCGLSYLRIVKRAWRGVLAGQLAPHPARWNVLIEQHVRSSRLNHQGAL
jgi:hypothetical protein